MRILITGANGKCGMALRDLPFEKIYLDKVLPSKVFSGESFIQSDLSDVDELREIISGCDAIIHLAASSNPESPWEEVFKDNIMVVQNVFRIAYEARVECVVFASSNHVVGMYELENAPGIYELCHSFKIDETYPPRPDSYYAVSKIFGENLGRYYAEMGGLRFYALRIGAVLDEFNDNPYTYAEDGVRKKLWKRGDLDYVLKLKRLKAIWLSRRDFMQMVDLCVRHEGGPFHLFFGTSDNPRSWLDISHAKKVLGYRPQDNAEEWTRLPDVYK